MVRRRTVVTFRFGPVNIVLNVDRNRKAAYHSRDGEKGGEGVWRWG